MCTQCRPFFSDKRVKDWFLMSSPLPTVCMCLSYAFIVKILGPWLMRNRKPFQLRKTLIIYNFLQVIFSTWLFWEAWDAAWGRGYSLRCEPVDYSTSPKAMRVRLSAMFFAHIRSKLGVVPLEIVDDRGESIDRFPCIARKPST